MPPLLSEGLNLVLRWAHLIAGIMWIGSSIFFHWLDSHMEKPFGDKLAKADFLSSCKSGMFDVNAKMDPDAPLKGANSFTENQARDRAMAFGMSDVSELKKDADGIWRGTGKLNGKSVPVAIDYKGNVVAK